MKLSQWCRLNQVPRATAVRMAENGEIKLEKINGRNHVVNATVVPPARHRLTGRRYGALFVEGPSGVKNRLGEVIWRLKCDCGKKLELSAYWFKSGMTKNCGCGRKGEKVEDQIVGCGGISATYWNNVLRRAKVKGYAVEITPEYLWRLFLAQDQKCALSGREITMGVRRQTASLDRINSSKGYVEGNVQWTHKDVNRAKVGLSPLAFIQLCADVAAHNGEDSWVRTSSSRSPVEASAAPTPATASHSEMKDQSALAE